MSRTVVIKLGGELISSEREVEARAIAKDVAAIAKTDRVVVVHGGGPQTTTLQESLGQKPVIVAGRRVTDDAALDAIKMIVAGKLNVDLCSLLRSEGVNAVGLHGVSGRVIAAEKRPPRVVSGGGDQLIDFLHVGDVVGLNRSLLELLSSAGYVPVLACIGSDASGRAYNINADAVASAVAGGLEADALVLVTNTPGVLKDAKDPSTRMPRLSVAQARAAIADGTIAGGMIPKVEEAFGALDKGVKSVRVVGRVGAGDLERALLADGSAGTTFVP
ncbi:MAG: acetylglutamate kinase [Deltaproteobacteria bacterium]|nr:acetylglutamate kinase [Deltaproteobacteria bacterium]